MLKIFAPCAHVFCKQTLLRASLITLLCTFAAGGTFAASKDQMRADVRKSAEQTLERLYKVAPAARQNVEGAAGYAVFNNFGMKIFFAGGGTGSGVAVNNKTHKEVFMKMIEVQAGLGIGIKKFRLVWVFETQQALDNFIDSGWEFGAQSTAAAKAGSTGAAASGAISVSPGVWIYQLTDDGLALEFTAKGTKYYRDDTLN
jgi:lipid-binding SYLF domain-containing protein